MPMSPPDAGRAASAGTAGSRLADASAAVRNKASRRVIVIRSGKPSDRLRKISSNPAQRRLAESLGNTRLYGKMKSVERGGRRALLYRIAVFDIGYRAGTCKQAFSFPRHDLPEFCDLGALPEELRDPQK